MPWKTGLSGFSLSELAKSVEGQVIGDEKVLIRTLCPLDEPGAGGLAYAKGLRAAQLKRTLEDSPLAALVVTEGLAAKLMPSKLPLLVVKDPFEAIVALIPKFYTPTNPSPGISPKAEIDPSAKIGRDVTIGPFCCIGANVEIEDRAILHPQVVIYPGARIGADAILHSGVVIREDCIVGPRCVIQNGAVIGSDGFGYIPDPKRGLAPIPQVGSVKIEADVDVGANSCLDRATLGLTKIGLGTKIDNLVQIGHNTKIGKYSILCGQVGIAGSVKLGDQVTIGGGAGVADHLTVVDKVRLGAKTAALRDVLEPGDYSGCPAVPVQNWMRTCAILPKLPELFKHVRQLQRK